MKKILYHFRISLLLGAIIFSTNCRIFAVNTNKPRLTQDATQSSPTIDDQDDNLILPDQPSNKFEFGTDLIIKAVNPVIHNGSVLMNGESVSLNFGDTIVMGTTKFRFDRQN